MKKIKILTITVIILTVLGGCSSTRRASSSEIKRMRDSLERVSTQLEMSRRYIEMSESYRKLISSRLLSISQDVEVEQLNTRFDTGRTNATGLHPVVEETKTTTRIKSKQTEEDRTNVSESEKGISKTDDDTKLEEDKELEVLKKESIKTEEIAKYSGGVDKVVIPVLLIIGGALGAVLLFYVIRKPK